MSNTQQQNCRTHSGTNSFIPQFLPLKSAPNRKRSQCVVCRQNNYDMLYCHISEWISDNRHKEIIGCYWLGNLDLAFDIRISDFATTHKIKNQISKLRNPLLRWIIIIIIIIIITYPTSEIVNFLLLHSFKRWVPYFNMLFQIYLLVISFQYIIFQTIVGPVIETPTNKKLTRAFPMLF